MNVNCPSCGRSRLVCQVIVHLNDDHRWTREKIGAWVAGIEPSQPPEDPCGHGGHPSDPKNLWPEMWGTPGTSLTSRGPFPPHLIGAKSKDVAENQLHKEVCAGTLPLNEAQQIIATDWFRYYRDHVLK